MKRIIAVFLIVSVIISLSACSAPASTDDGRLKELETQVAEKDEKIHELKLQAGEKDKKIEDLETQVGEKDQQLKDAESELASQKSSYEEELKSLVPKEEYDTLLGEKAQIEKDYADYKESMKIYEELSAAEAEQKKLEAEAEANRLKEEAEAEEQARKEEEERRKREEEEARAAEEAKGYETGITFDQLARTPDEYEGKKVKFKGRVVQVMESDGEVDIRLAVNNDWDDILLGYYEPSIVSSRVLEDDTITIYGVSMGLYTYESTMGASITVPLVQIDRIDQ